MKLIMENWKRFLNEDRPPVDPRLLPALAQDAMEVVAANPGIDIASITLATMAQAGSELPLIDMESVATITLGDLFDEIGLQDIMQGAAEFAADEVPPPGGGQWATPEVPDEEDTLEEGWGQGDRAYQQASQLLGKFAQMHGLRNQVADALRQGKVTPQRVQTAVRLASSSYHVAQQLGLEE